MHDQALKKYLIGKKCMPVINKIIPMFFQESCNTLSQFSGNGKPLTATEWFKIFWKVSFAKYMERNSELTYQPQDIFQVIPSAFIKFF